MTASKPHYLLDLNALISLADPDALHYKPMLQWFDETGKDDWGVCPLTEAGFIRVTTNPRYTEGSRSVAQAMAILREFSGHPGYRYWPIRHSWVELTAPFAGRIQGHQQVTDAYLLGMAIQRGGVLVTFDRGIAYLAGSEFTDHLLVLEP